MVSRWMWCDGMAGCETFFREGVRYVMMYMMKFGVLDLALLCFSFFLFGF